MFDRYYLRASPSSISVSVDEKRAPTDESVRLLREMEDAARTQVAQSLRIESCGVEAVVHRQDNPMDAKTMFAIHYKVNGVQRKCYAAVDWQADIRERLDTVWATLAKDLAAYLIGGIAKPIIGRA
jgi:hypothetical protein